MLGRSVRKGDGDSVPDEAVMVVALVKGDGDSVRYISAPYGFEVLELTLNELPGLSIDATDRCCSAEVSPPLFCRTAKLERLELLLPMPMFAYASTTLPGRPML